MHDDAPVTFTNYIGDTFETGKPFAAFLKSFKRRFPKREVTATARIDRDGFPYHSIYLDGQIYGQATPSS